MKLRHCIYIYALAYFAFLYLPHCARVVDNDVWWHLKTGQLIAQTHHVPTTDPFTFTAHGQPWVAQEWLSEVIFHSFYAMRGYQGVLILDSVLLFLILAGIGELVRRRLKPTPLVFMVATLCALGTQPFWAPRPQLFTYLCLTVLLLLLDRPQEKALWLTIPLFCLWSNLHGVWLVGFAVLALTLADYIGLAILQKRPEDAIRFVTIGLLSLAAVLIGPNPVSRLLYPIVHSVSALGTVNVAEFNSPDFHMSDFFPFLITLALLPIATYLGRKQMRLSTWVLMIGGMSMALLNMRNVPLFSIILAPILALQISSACERFEEKNGLINWTGMPEKVMLNWLTLPLLIACIIISFPKSRNEDDYDTNGFFPARACRYLITQPTIGRGRLLNNYNWGGYLIFKLWPKYMTSMDGRGDVHHLHLEEDAKKLERLASPDWRKQLAKRDPDVILWPANKPLVVMLDKDPDWKSVYRDSMAVIYVRTAPSVNH